MITLHISFVMKNIGRPHRDRLLKHPLCTTYLLFLTVRFVIFQTNTKLLINQLKIYSYTRHLTPLLDFKKKECSLSWKVLETYTF